MIAYPCTNGYITLKILALIIPLILLNSHMLHAASPTGKIVKEVIEVFRSKFLKTAGKNLDELTDGVSIIVKKHGKKGVQILKKHGPSSVDLIKTGGTPALEVIYKFGEKGVTVLKNNNNASMLFKKFGDNAINVLYKHPGVGGALIQKFGAKGVNIGMKIKKLNVIRFLKWEKNIKDKKIISKISKNIGVYGNKFFDFIETHPKLTLTATGATLLVNNPGLLNELGKGAGHVIEGAGAGVGNVIEGSGKGLIGGVTGGNDYLVALLILCITGAISFLVYLKYKIFRRKGEN